MKKIVSIFASFMIICSLAGCAFLGQESAAVFEETAEAVFNQALTTATAVLTAEGTQALAIAAAQSYVAGKVQNEAVQNVCNEIIAQAVPTIAEGLGKIGTRGGTAKERAVNKARIYTASEEYKKLVAKCVTDFELKSAN